MAETDPAGFGTQGGNEASSVFRGTTDVKVNYKDVTGLVEQMDKLAASIKKVHDALGTLNETKIQEALSGLKGVGGGGAGGGGGGSGSTAGTPNGGFAIGKGVRYAGLAAGAATLLAGAYDRRAAADLTSDVTAMRTVYTSDKPSFGLRQATTLTAQQFGPYALGREDMLAGAAATMGRYGGAESQGQRDAARGAGVFAMSSLQGTGYGAEMYNALNAPQVLNRVRMYGGGTRVRVDDTTAMASEMARIAFGTATPTNAVLNNMRPGTPQFNNLMMLSGGDQGLMNEVTELTRARSRYEKMGSPKGAWTDETMRSIGKDKDLQKQLFGENSLYLSKQKLESGKAMRAEEVLNLSRNGLVKTNDLLAMIAANTSGLSKWIQTAAALGGNAAGALGGGAGVMGQALNMATDVAMIRALGGRGGGGGGGLLAKIGLGGAAPTANAVPTGAGALARVGPGLTGLGIGAVGGQVIDDLIGNPKDKKGVDVGNILRYGGMGAGIGATLGAGVFSAPGAAIGGAVGLGIGTAKEFLFGGDPIDSRGYGGVGDPVPDGGAQPSGMSVGQAEEILRSRGGHVSGIAGLASDFKVKLGMLFAQNPKLSLSSGARSRAEQERLYQRWINKVPGQAPAAKPGSSNHEFGLAADIGPSSEYGWLAGNAPKVGLVKPMSYEPWHWEPPGAKARRGQGGTNQADQTTGVTDQVAPKAVLGTAVERVTALNPSKQPGRAASLSGTALSAAAAGGMAVSGAGDTAAGSAAGGGGGGGAGAITINEAARAARAAGVPDDQIAMAVAIAMAESGLNPRAHNPVPPDDSYGLWQINMLGSMGPDRRKSLGIDKNDALFQPNINAKAMAQISGGGHNWRPWSTYGNNAYEKHMGAVQTALKTGVGDPIAPTTGGTTPSMSSTMMVSGGGGSGVHIVAPIHLSIKEATDAEAERFARQVKSHLTGIVADIDNARSGI